MKSIAISALLSSMFAAALYGQAPVATPAKCEETLKNLEAKITKEPSRVLLEVEDAVTVSENCAGEIVKTAITVSKADPKLVGEIVAAAVTAAPASASTIGEYALNASPEAAGEIKKALQAALGQGDIGGSSDKESASGKEPVAAGKEPVASGKEPVGKEPVGKEPLPALPVKTPDDFTGADLTPSGIYLTVPANGPVGKEKEVVIKVIRTTEVRKKHKPRTGSTPVTGS